MITKAFKWVQRLMYLPVDISSLPVTAETVTIPAGAAGVVVNFQLAHGAIANAGLSDLGGFGDSSLSGYAATFTTEVAYGTPDTELTNGQFYLDYLTGKGRGKKADTATSMASIAYSYRTLRVDTEAAAQVAAGDATANPTAGQNLSYIHALNNAGTPTWDRIRAGITTIGNAVTGFLNTLPWAIFNTTPTTRTNGQGGPLQASSAGSLNVNLDALSSAIDSITSHSGASASVTGSDTYYNSALSNTAVAMKASAGNFYGWDQVYNSGGAVSFVQMFDLATGSVTLGTTTPKHSYLVPAAGTFDNIKQVPNTYAVAITVAATLTATGSGAPSANFNANASYK